LVDHVLQEIKSKSSINNNGILIGSGYCEVLSRKGKLTEGLESFKKAQGIFQLSQNALLEATALKGIGHLLAAENKFKDA
jgi:hypothetical protein